VLEIMRKRVEQLEKENKEKDEETGRLRKSLEE
jgi:hypothetical protein